MKCLNEIPIGTTVQLKKIEGSGSLKRRMMDMGLTKGTEITVRKVAPLGDPLEIIVRGYSLSLRKAEAKCLVVQ